MSDITDAVNLVVRGGKITGTYGRRAQVPGTPSKTGAFHYGMDIAAPTGTPILSLSDGVVTRARIGADGAYDMIVTEKSGMGWRYVHNSKHHAKVGDDVFKGQHIANVGATGNVNGAHVHLERLTPIYAAVDPYPQLLALVSKASNSVIPKQGTKDMYRLKIVDNGHPENGAIFLIYNAKREWIKAAENDSFAKLGVPLVEMSANEAYNIFRTLDRIR